MREIAAAWFANHLGGRGEVAPITEPPLAPIAKREQAVSLLNFWPNQTRPPDMLSPTAYVQREIAALITKLPPVPEDLPHWQVLRQSLREKIPRLLLSPRPVKPGAPQLVGTFRAKSSKIQKIVVHPEAGIEIPMLLFGPSQGVKPNNQLVVLLHPDGMRHTVSSKTRAELADQGMWVLCVDLRGMGETRFDQESGGYLGFRDLDISMTAIKLGDTLAGYWVRDLLAAIEAARDIAGNKLKVTIRADKETALVAILAASQSEHIGSVEGRGLLASYLSPQGYGLPFAYSDENNSKAVRGRKLGGYGTMLPCIPHILDVADVCQLAALVSPRPLRIIEPDWASGQPLGKDEARKAFAWTREVYRLDRAEAAFSLSSAPSTQPSKPE